MKIGEELLRASVASRLVVEVPLLEVPALGLVQEVKAVAQALALAQGKDQGEDEGEGTDTGWADAEPRVW